MEQTKITNEDFVAMYVTSKTYREVAKRLGISLNRVHTRARYLRKVGVNLPKKAAEAQRLDVNKLNKVAMLAKQNKVL